LTRTVFGLVLVIVLAGMLTVTFNVSSAKVTVCAGSTSLTSAIDDWSAHPMFVTFGSATTDPAGLSPAQIRVAYNLPSTGGHRTIAIVDAYDDPTVLNDLSVFSSQFALPPLNSTNFEKHKMTLGIGTDSGWALEISLDVQWAHAVAPDAKILLVEARDSSRSNLLAAVDYARNRPDVVAISMSWGGSEFSGESSYDSHFTSSYGAYFYASSGDHGENVSWPACSPNVVGVGGTTLTFAGDGSVASETAWSGSGGGVSEYEIEPNYQLLYGVPSANGHRSVPDVSYDADPNSGVAVYDSTPYSGRSGWWQVGGTSAGAPQWAAIQSIGLTASNDNFYPVASSSYYHSYFRDITSGTNGNYSAMSRYDHVTGLGSPLAINYKMLATIYINGNGSITPVTAPISTVDKITYTFTGNIYNSSIVAERNNITLDGAGYTLQGTGAQNSVGIDLSRRTNVTVHNIQIKAFTNGIWLNDSTNNTIYGNNITTNTAYGILLSNSSNYNTIFANNVTNNGDGIYLYGYSYVPSNNRIYHNNFINNSQQVSSNTASRNAWDDGYPSGGNYWSNYTGVDNKSGPYQNLTGSDGIGDTSYIIGVNNSDNYPLMNPWTPPDIAITSVTLSKAVVGEGDSISVNVTVENEGCLVETPNVTLYGKMLYGNPWPIYIFTSVTLVPEAATTLTINLGLTMGLYGLNAYAWPVQGETHTSDNTYTGPTILVSPRPFIGHGLYRRPIPL
jgi:parallel beta-helix repeat protein